MRAVALTLFTTCTRSPTRIAAQCGWSRQKSYRFLCWPSTCRLCEAMLGVAGLGDKNEGSTKDKARLIVENALHSASHAGRAWLHMT